MSYVRDASGRCPAETFLDECQKSMRKKFDGSFGAVAKMGEAYHVPERFKPLKDKGKPLWEFKEHDHRLYCLREVLADGRVEVVVFNGWVKDKKGKTDRERREIETAQALLAEYRGEKEGE